MALMDARKTKFYNYIDQSDNKIKLKALSLTRARHERKRRTCSQYHAPKELEAKKEPY